MSWTVNKFDSNEALIIQLTEKIVGDLQQAVGDRGSASMAVSGGSTPKSLFARLAASDLPWDKVFITLVDERWVDADHPDSNARLVRENLLQDRAAAANFIPLKTPAPDPFSAEEEVQSRLRDLRMPFDVVILGMGGDGHTASFFPGAETLRRALHPDSEKQLCCAVRPPHAPHDRMTLTLPVLLAAKHLILHLVGKDKWQVLQKALQPGKTEELPVRSVLHQSKVLLDVYYAAE
ncbi:6-phosphogluconolactonase [Proteobacteria bacterium 005FR1]|nr:6-phosphogluconolactonase [Proteobacteria bacterium 005FR1]